MANLTEVPTTWPGGVYKLERTDAADAGANQDGPLNLPAVALANRTAFLKAAMEAVITGEGGVVDNADSSQFYAALLTAIAAGTAPAGSAAPVGAVVASAAIAVPTGWLSCDGSAISRAAYANLYAALTIQQAGDTSAASAVISNMTDTADMAAGMPITGTYIPAGTTILSVDSATQITLSANATGNAVGDAITVAPWGHGDGSVTFNLPDLRGEFLRGLDDGRGVDSGRALGSSQADELRAHTHDYSRAQYGVAGGLTGNNPNNAGLAAALTAPSGGSETRPRNIAVRYIIKT